MEWRESTLKKNAGKGIGENGGRRQRNWERQKVRKARNTVVRTEEEDKKRGII